jgi:hypothetical protein
MDSGTELKMKLRIRTEVTHLDVLRVNTGFQPKDLFVMYLEVYLS